jgi:voltage-gated sodium channel
MDNSHSDAAQDGSRDGDASCGFVERGWFQVITAFVILANTATLIAEIDEPCLKETFYITDQAMLCFYVFELLFRLCFLRARFCLGPMAMVAWSTLDLVVVLAGVFDQWLLPLFPVTRSRPLQTALSVLRLLRILRVLKIVRVFLETDLSWTERPRFQSFVGGVITFNALLMGFETDIDWWGWFYMEQFLLCIYVFELSVRLKRFGLHFLSCHNPDIIWNVLDFIIVATSVLDSWMVPLIGIFSRAISGAEKEQGKKSGMSLGQVMMLLRMLRLMRILRLVKLVKSIRPLYILVTGVVQAFQGVAWVMILTIMVLYAMAILVTRLIGHKLLFGPDASPPDTITAPFATVTESMFTLFRVMNGAASMEEQEAIDEIMVSLPSIRFAFVFFMVTSSWTLLSILTAVVSDNMISATTGQRNELSLEHEVEIRMQHEAELTDIFGRIDVSGTGMLVESELKSFLQNKENALLCAKSCHVAVRNVVDVLQTLSVDGKPVPMKDFVACMVDVSKCMTQKDSMKMKTHLAKMEQKACFRDLEDKTQAIGRKWDEVLAFEPELGQAMEGLQRSIEQVLREQEAQEQQSLDSMGNLTKLIGANADALADLDRSIQALQERKSCHRRGRA